MRERWGSPSGLFLAATFTPQPHHIRLQVVVCYHFEYRRELTVTSDPFRFWKDELPQPVWTDAFTTRALALTKAEMTGRLIYKDGFIMKKRRKPLVIDTNSPGEVRGDPLIDLLFEDVVQMFDDS